MPREVIYRKEKVKSLEIGGTEEFQINKAAFCVLVPLVWIATAYLRAKTNIWMRWRFGPLPLDDEMPEGVAHPPPLPPRVHRHIYFLLSSRIYPLHYIPPTIHTVMIVHLCILIKHGLSINIFLSQNNCFVVSGILLNMGLSEM